MPCRTERWAGGGIGSGFATQVGGKRPGAMRGAGGVTFRRRAQAPAMGGPHAQRKQGTTKSLLANTHTHAHDSLWPLAAARRGWSAIRKPPSLLRQTPCPHRPPPGHWGPKAPAAQERAKKQPNHTYWGSACCSTSSLAEDNCSDANCLQPPSAFVGQRVPAPQLKAKASGTREAARRVPCRFF